jgi:CHAD domain-containing protein
MTVNATAAVVPDAPDKRPLHVVGMRNSAAADARDQSVAGTGAMRDLPSEPQLLDAARAPRGPGIALRDYGLAELAVAIDSLALRGSHVHEGVHQARKAMRRTRALLALGVATLGPGAKLIDHQLRASNRRTSPLRDAQALVETLDRLRTKARDDATRAALEHARRIAARRRAAMARKPEFTQALRHEEAIVATLRAALLGLPWDTIATSMVTEAMVVADKRAASARERACARDDAEAWHRWRRRMRRISQQHRAANAAGLPVSDTEFDKNMTEQLGVLQDLNLLVAHCGEDSPFSTDKSTLRRFAERTLSKQRKRIRSVVALAVSTAA